MKNIIKLDEIKGFDWDRGNLLKNLSKHKVKNLESEEIFFNQPLLILPDTKHSQREKRLYALGKTNNHRLLFVVFTIRKNLIHIISARDMSSKERSQYEKI